VSEIANGFSWLQKTLHAVSAVLVLAMLLIGTSMVSTVGPARIWLLQWHRPLGITLLVLGLWRLGLRWRRPAPPLPDAVAGWQKQAAHASHWLLYGLLVAMPLIGWAMVSAAGDPVQLLGGVTLPPIAPTDPGLFATLRSAHGLLARLFLLVVIGHLGAALMHGLIQRDGVFQSMWRWSRRTPSAARESSESG